MVPWNAGAAVIRPYERIIPDDDGSMMNRAFFHNFRAQAAWSLRSRFYKTWKTIKHGDVYPVSELISLDSSMPTGVLSQMRKELAQPVRGSSVGSMKMLVQKTPPGTKSPNLFDATVQAYFPAPDNGNDVTIGSYSA